MRMRAIACVPGCRLRGNRHNRGPQFGVRREQFGVHREEAAQWDRKRQHPLANRHFGDDVIDQPGGGFRHSPRPARGANPAPLARKSHQLLVAALRAAHSQEAMRKDAADTAIRGHDLDEAKALEAQQRAQEAMQNRTSRMEYAKAAAELAEAAAQLAAIRKLRKK